MAVSTATTIAGIDITAYTKDTKALAAIQSTFGTLQPGQLQANRRQFYSYLQYPNGGTPELVFFGNATGSGGTDLQDTNMPVQGSFGTSSILLKRIIATYLIEGSNEDTLADGTDANSFYAEMVGGIFNAGFFSLQINALTYIELANPFLELPPSDGRSKMFATGATTVDTWPYGFADLVRKTDRRWNVDPELFINEQQTFQAKIIYPSGVMPLVCTGLTGGGMTLKVGIIFDGIEFRPVQ